MASAYMVAQLERAKLDLDIVTASSNFGAIRNNGDLQRSWEQAKLLALRWFNKAEPRMATVDDTVLQPLERFATELTKIAEGGGVRQTEDIPIAIRRVQNEFLATVPLLAYELLEASGLFQLSENALNNWRESTKNDIHDAVDAAEVKIKAIVAEADGSLKTSAIEAGKEFELAKERSQRITVDRAEQ